MRRLIAAAAAVAALAGVAAAAAPVAPDWASLGLTGYPSPKPAPEFALPDLDGRTRTLGEFRGRALLLFFWATW